MNITLLHGLALTAAAILLGAGVLQSTVVARTVFRNLDSHAAPRFLQQLFIRYFQFGLGVSVVLLAALGAGAMRREPWLPDPAPLVGLSAFVIVSLLSSLWLVPRINAARDSGRSRKRRYALLRVLSILANVGSLLATLAILLFLASTP